MLSVLSVLGANAYCSYTRQIDRYVDTLTIQIHRIPLAARGRPFLDGSNCKSRHATYKRTLRRCARRPCQPRYERLALDSVPVSEPL